MNDLFFLFMKRILSCISLKEEAEERRMNKISFCVCDELKCLFREREMIYNDRLKMNLFHLIVLIELIV